LAESNDGVNAQVAPRIARPSPPLPVRERTISLPSPLAGEGSGVRGLLSLNLDVLNKRSPNNFL
jgi:hypothetical protein